MRIPRGAPAVAALLAAAACRSAPEAAAVADLEGALHRPLEVRAAAAHVLFFVTTDCPIANSYAPEIAAIVADHRGEPLRFFVVHVDPDVTPDAAAEHAAAFALPAPILLDRHHRLVRATGIGITPEVAVVLPGGELAYRGRIDDAWGDLGRRRPRPTQRDLRDALRCVLAGIAVARPRTEAIGCDIPLL